MKGCTKTMTAEHDLKILRARYLRGPNIWTYRSVLEVWLDLGPLEQQPSNAIPGFVDRLLALLPSVGDHKCGVGEVGGFLQRLVEGTWAGHVLEHVVIELLNQAGMPTGFGQTRSTSRTGVYRMVFRARDEEVARAALDAGHRLLLAALNGRPFDVPAAVQQVRDKIDDCYLGPSTACIVAGATDRGIPHIRLNDGNLVQLGYGSRQCRIWTAETDRTSAIAEGIAREKDLTKTLLRACGVPVPEGEVAGSPEAAWEAAQEIGLPVVVKPSDGNHGRGVTLDLSTREEVEAAWHVADRHGSEVLVERYIRGEEHRLLVVGGRVVAAARGESAWVTGDGVQTVDQLVDSQINTDPRRGLTEDHPLNFIRVEDDAVVQLDLQRQGLTADAVPAAGRRVLIQRNGNVAIDCTDQVHPEVDHIVSLAARVVGLDIAGIDLVAEDISRPLHEQGAAIVEVNAGPGLLMHLKPAQGEPRPVGRAIVDHVFPPPPAEAGVDRSGRIPIVGVAGTREGTLIARLVAWLLQLSGPRTGVACRDGLFLGKRRLDAGDAATWHGGQRLLMNRSVDAAVFENGPVAMLDDGLAYDRCDVGIVTDAGGGPALADWDVHEDSQWFRVLRTQVDVVRDDGTAVLNAADPAVMRMAELCDGSITVYGADPALPALQAHRDAGGRAVTLRDGRTLVLAQGADETPVLDLEHDLRRTRGLVQAHVDAVLAAVAAAWALGVAPAFIRAGLDSFEAGGPVAAA